MPGKFNSILLVDDDRTTNHFNKLLLEDMALAEQIQLASHGQEALSLIKETVSRSPKEQPSPMTSLIFLDLYMPVMNGIEFLKALEQQYKEALQQGLCIVLLTSSSQPGDLELAKNFRIANVLKKPLTSEKVKLVVREVFKAREPGK
ncbi:response regulator [Nafulsella turpanensis]|uniref:response regulator n=1 Tax=Nafulsella turpanensis TaxID=1265690 RepID=UPI000348502C|nr:response regulator [Nafulsella turpanensis]